jgi:hypothetical protein
MIRGALKLKNIGEKGCGTCINSKFVKVEGVINHPQLQCNDADGWIWVSRSHVCNMHSFPGSQRRTRMVRAL